MSKPHRHHGEESTGIPRLDALRENRRDLRFKLYVNVTIHSPSLGSVLGKTLEISERGLSATVPVELPVGEVVELNPTLRIGPVNFFASAQRLSLCLLLRKTDIYLLLYPPLVGMEKGVADADIRSWPSGCDGFAKVLSGFHRFEINSFDDITNVQTRSLYRAIREKPCDLNPTFL